MRTTAVLLSLSVAACCGLMPNVCSAQTPVTLTLHDGRSVVGLVDDQTNRQALALRNAEKGIELISSFAWLQIRSLQFAEETLTGSAAVEWALENRSRGATFADLITEASPPSTKSVEKVKAVPIRPASISILGQLANWDRDAAPEGIEVALMPVDAAGLPAPARGQLELKLIIEQDPLIDIGGVSHQPAYREIAKKSFSVEVKNFVNGVAIFRLPIRELPTDLPNDVACTGLVHARLSIPGYRVLSASDSQVMLRDMTRFREQKRLFSQERFFPFENR